MHSRTLSRLAASAAVALALGLARADEAAAPPTTVKTFAPATAPSAAPATALSAAPATALSAAPATALSAAPATALSAAPATAPSANISPEARAILDESAEAYRKLKSLELGGTLTGDFEAGGQKQGGNETFTSRFVAPNMFVHQSKDPSNGDFTLGSTGDQMYLFAKQSSSYLQQPSPKNKVAISELPDPFPRLLPMQNPSLTLALAKNPAGELIDNAAAAEKVSDLKIGDTSYPSVKLTQRDGTQTTLSFDPASHLIRQASQDIRTTLQSKGVQDVVKAQTTIDYTTTNADAQVPPEQFAWAPPAGAKDISAAADVDAAALVGKTAPPFKATGLDGKDVALSELKGHVVVLDFWATWCPPCRKSLPHLDELYHRMKDKGVEVFAVNQEETKEKIQAFVDKTKLTVPVLLDVEGKINRDYGASGIPQTVVIDKDGKVVKVIIGFDEAAVPAELQKVVGDALK